MDALFFSFEGDKCYTCKPQPQCHLWSVRSNYFVFPLMGKNYQWLPMMIRLPKLLQVQSCILDEGPIQLCTVSSELKLVLARWELTMSCWERKADFGNDMWYQDYSFLQFVILSNLTKLKGFFNQEVLVGTGRLVRKDTVTPDHCTRQLCDVVCV